MIELIQEQLTSDSISETLLVYQLLLENKTFNEKQLTEIKNKIIRIEINRQLTDKGRFNIDHPFSNPCKKCHGLGEIFKVKEPLTIPCKSCNGIGVFPKTKKKCRTCRGKGTKKVIIMKRIQKHSVCNRCKGTGIFKDKRKESFNPIFSQAFGDKLKYILIKTP